jgi:hypothetical protein
VFLRMMEGLAAASATPKTIMIDATYLQGTPHGIKPAGKKGYLGRLIGCTTGGMNTKLHADTDAAGRPLSFFMTAGEVSDYTSVQCCSTICQGAVDAGRSTQSKAGARFRF